MSYFSQFLNLGSRECHTVIEANSPLSSTVADRLAAGNTRVLRVSTSQIIQPPLPVSLSSSVDTRAAPDLGTRAELTKRTIVVRDSPSECRRHLDHLTAKREERTAPSQAINKDPDTQ